MSQPSSRGFPTTCTTVVAFVLAERPPLPTSQAGPRASRCTLKNGVNPNQDCYSYLHCQFWVVHIMAVICSWGSPNMDNWMSSAWLVLSNRQWLPTAQAPTNPQPARFVAHNTGTVKSPKSQMPILRQEDTCVNPNAWGLGFE